MMRRQAAFARVLQAAGERRAAVHGLDCRAAQRSEAHARDVDDRRRPERFRAPAMLAKHLGRRHAIVRIEVGLVLVRRSHGKRAVLDDRVVRRRLEIVVRSEAEVVVLQLRRGIDPSPLVAAERPLFGVAGDDVLPELRPDRLEQVSEVSHDGEIAQNGMLALSQVEADDCQCDEREYTQGDRHNRGIGNRRQIWSESHSCNRGTKSVRHGVA